VYVSPTITNLRQVAKSCQIEASDGDA